MRAKSVTAALVLALALTACGVGTKNPPSTSLPDTAGSDTTPGTEKKPTTGDLSATITWDDGLAVTLTDLKRGKSGLYAHPGNTEFTSFKVTFTNGAAKDIDLTLLTVKCSTGPDGDNAEAIFDSEQGLGDGVDGTVQRGKKKSGAYGCVMADDVKELQVEIELFDDLNRDPAIFSGEV